MLGDLVVADHWTGRTVPAAEHADGNARTYGRADPGADGHAVPDACADDGGVR